MRLGTGRLSASVVALIVNAVVLSASSALPTLAATQTLRAQPPEGSVDYAVSLEDSGRLKQALAAYDAVLAGQRGDAVVLARRGGVHFKLGDNKAALRDFDRAVELEPRLGPQLWQRGLSLYYAERWDDCITQFVSHRTVNPDDVENAVWHFLCVARKDGIAAARRAILPVGPDRRVPMEKIYELFQGSADEAAVMEQAQTSRVGVLSCQLFYAHLYLGLWDEVNDRPAAALKHLEAAVALDFPHYMGDMARVHVQWLGDADGPQL